VELKNRVKLAVKTRKLVKEHILKADEKLDEMYDSFEKARFEKLD